MLGIKLSLNDGYIRNVIGMANMPLLMFDQYWLALFPREHKSARITNCERRIVDLMKKEARIREKLRLLSDKKQKALANIQSLTAEAFTYKKKSAILEIKRSKRVILAANAYFLLAGHQLKVVEDEIQKVNRDLLEETVKVCYALMHESKERIGFLEPKVIQLREDLKTITLELAETEAQYERTYNLLHKLIGADVINQLDESGGFKKKWF